MANERKEKINTGITSIEELAKVYSNLRYDLYRLLNIFKLLNYLHGEFLEGNYPRDNSKQGLRWLYILNEMIEGIIKSRDKDMECIDFYLEKFEDDEEE